MKMSDTAVSSSLANSQVPPAAAPAVSLLEASRRVDWRFLLPDPNLGSVVAAGGVSPSLREALALFCQQVTYVEGLLASAGELPQADLAVICGELGQPAEAALKRVKPAGFCYVETTSRTLAQSQQFLRARGFEDIEVFWHSPNFEGCKRIIPLDNPAALVYALRKTDQPVMRWLTREAVYLAHRSGALKLAARSISLIARRGGA